MQQTTTTTTTELISIACEKAEQLSVYSDIKWKEQIETSCRRSLAKPVCVTLTHIVGLHTINANLYRYFLTFRAYDIYTAL